MKCKECHSTILSGQNYCSKCGAEICAVNFSNSSSNMQSHIKKYSRYLKKGFLLYLAFSLIGTAFIFDTKITTLGLIPIALSGVYVLLVAFNLLPKKYITTKFKHVMILTLAVIGTFMLFMAVEMFIKLAIK